MNNAILYDVKNYIGLSPDMEDTTMDNAIVIFINSAFDDLARIGVGQYGGFSIVNKDETWDDYLPEDLKDLLSSIKSYVCIYTVMHWDTPTGAKQTALEEALRKLEFTIQTAIELKDESESPAL